MREQRAEHPYVPKRASAAAQTTEQQPPARRREPSTTAAAQPALARPTQAPGDGAGYRLAL
jgi:hypothetical protein